MQKTKSIALVLGVLSMSILLSYLVLAWTEPTAPPPGGNVPAPINVGSAQQWKEGGLGVGIKTFDLSSGQISASTFYDRDDSSWFVNPAGISLLKGNVGIGTTGPWAKLAIEQASGNSGVGIHRPGVSAGGIAAGLGGVGAIHIFGNRWTPTTGEAIRFGWAPWNGDWNDFTEKMRINTDGNVGIGTVAPEAKLDVNGAIKFGDTASVCDATGRGTMKFVDGAVGVSDKVYQCMKNANNVYSWALVAVTPLPPSQVTGLSATAGNTQVVLNWVASENNGNAINNYKVYQGITSGGETLLTTLGNVLTYTNTGLTNDITYYYKVSAVNVVGEGSQSSEVSAVSGILLTWTGSTHSQSQCLTLGGTVYDTGSGTICEYHGASVPPGWTQADSWQRYSVGSWGAGDRCGNHKSYGPTSFQNTGACYLYRGEDRYTSPDAFCPGDSWAGEYRPEWNNYLYSRIGCAANPTTNRAEVGIY